LRLGKVMVNLSTTAEYRIPSFEYQKKKKKKKKKKKVNYYWCGGDIPQVAHSFIIVFNIHVSVSWSIQ